MSNRETLEVPRQLESHELHSWPGPVSQPAVSEPATRTLPQNPEVDREVFAENDHEISQLAPVDGGIAAWRLLGAAFVFETLLWGFPLSFGVFQDYYSRIPAFASSPYISVVGTIASGLGYIGAPFILPFIQKYQRWRRQMVWVGWPICIGGLVAGSFANTLGTLILTQGVAYGVGFLILYYPILMMVNEYWIARRGMAYGLLCGASGVSGAVMPFVVQALLSKYGYQTTLRAVAVSLAVLTGPLIPFLDGRLPPSAHVNAPKTNWSFFKSPPFWLYSISNLFQGFGYFFPSLYLPSFATSLDLGERSGPVLLAVMSVSQVTGQFAFGYLSDRKVPLDVLASTSTLVAAVTTVTMWRLADYFPVLIGYTILYGFFGAGFTAIWARMSTTVTDDATAGPIVFGLLNFGKGVGNVLAGPIGGLLVHNSSALQHSSAAESLNASSYYWVIIFTGCFSFPFHPSCPTVMRYSTLSTALLALMPLGALSATLPTKEASSREVIFEELQEGGVLFRAYAPDNVTDAPEQAPTLEKRGCNTGANFPSNDAIKLKNNLQNSNPDQLSNLPARSILEWSLGDAKICVFNKYFFDNTHIKRWEAGWVTGYIKDSCCGGNSQCRHQTKEMESSKSKGCPESRSSVGRDELNEIFQVDGAWGTAWEEPIWDTNGMVLVDAKQYAAFLEWQAGSHEGESANSSLEPKGKSSDICEKKENTDPTQLEKQESNIHSSQHDAEDHTRDSPSDDEAQVLCEEFESKMDRVGIPHEFRHILKHPEMSQLIDNDMNLFKVAKLVKFVDKKDDDMKFFKLSLLLEKIKEIEDEKRQKSSHNGRN
ncbi:monocarboxylate transporter 2 [Fusarium tjaetaba]|uniref:Monocarboxylate transporter 2 n=1 Tax=Fusarium tjaetaba TaxID=1567544 RepID=A0A8H5VFD5_9HYPO|nr:monocarboxylate transporter 2 [Fusarium tjaetaba]KAF5619159.1 monocarboxylate transporter 2 [Fusarium tjaetaba]